MIAIFLNGESRQVPSDWTLAQLLSDLGRDPRTVAIEYNGGILPRQQFTATRLAAGDRLEIVQFVQGG